MTQDDVFNILHYFSWWQLALIAVVLALAVFWLSTTKAWWVALLPLIIVFVLPMYNIGIIVYGVVLLGIFILGMRWGEKRRAAYAAAHPKTVEQLRAEQAKRNKGK